MGEEQVEDSQSNRQEMSCRTSGRQSVERVGNELSDRRERSCGAGEKPLVS